MSFGFGFSLPTLGWHLSGGGASSGYSVTKSLRFRSSASAYLNRTPATAGNRTTWTWSGWVKRGTLSTGTTQRIFSVDSSPSGGPSGIWFNGTTDTLNVVFTNDTGINYTGATTTAVFRDPAAWYHVTVACDTTQATNTNRIRIYINGVIQTTVVFSTGYPSLNDTGLINLNRLTLIGQYASVQFFDGELAEVNFVDGYPTGVTSGTWAATNVATIFGAYSTYNQWLPIRYAGTYGTNGFYLPFSATSASSYAGSFNGSTQYLTVPNNAAFTLGTTATMEAWIYVTSTTGNKRIVTTGANIDSFDFGLYTSTNTVFVAGGNANTTTAIPLNTWVHVAAVFNSGTLAIYFNGIAQSLSGVTTGYNLVASTLSAVFIGGQNAANFPGQISNLRVVKGTAVYTANFVPPTTALTAVTNTSLLTLQNATIVDNSTNAFTITNVGTVVTSVQSPFLNPTVLTADSSGNANNWTPNNISLTAGSTYDSLTDVPTLTSTTAANYCVLNPLDSAATTGVSSNGNLTWTNAAVTHQGVRGSIAIPATGAFYIEGTNVTANGAAVVMGFGLAASTVSLSTNMAGTSANSFNFYSGGSSDTLMYAGTTLLKTFVGGAFAAGDVIQLAVDTTNTKMWLGKNNVWYNSVGNTTGDPSTGANPTFTTSMVGLFLMIEAVANSINMNFGQRPFTYTPPSGFLPLNTFNI